MHLKSFSYLRLKIKRTHKVMKRLKTIVYVRRVSRRIPAQTQVFVHKVGMSMIPASLYTFGVEHNKLSIDSVHDVAVDTASVEALSIVCKILIHSIIR